MNFTPLLLTVALTAAPGDNPAGTFDFKKHSIDFQVARSKAASAAKTPDGEQPPFSALLPLLEREQKALADAPNSADATAIRRHLATYFGLYPTEPKARELLASVLADMTPTEAASARLQAVQAIDRAVGNPVTLRADVPKLLTEAEVLLARAEKDMAGANEEQAKKFARRVESVRHVIKNLVPGKTAPAIECRDLAGKPVKLSDYTGKVVVLDVWTTGCIPCRKMIPHQREMVARLKDLPFALVSVSFDAEPKVVTDFLKDTPMPWEHWFNGPDGGMAEAYKISHFPTIYVIDGKGVIRFKEVRDSRLDEAVNALLVEAGVPAAKLKAHTDAAPAPTGREEQLKALRTQYAKQNSDAMQLPRTGTPEQQLKAYEAALPKMRDYAPRALAIANEGSADEIALEALAFIAMTGQDSPEGADAFRQMAERFATASGVSRLLDRPTVQRPAVRPFAERVIAVHPDRATRAKAAVVLANNAIRQTERGDTPAASAAASAEAEAILRRIIEDFAGANLGGRLGTADAWAKSMLPEVVDLAVGKPFPDVTGEGMDGKSVKVSDYRGKVVVFDIWATWCGPCKAMIPHERELVARLKDKPFVLLSVSGDNEKKVLTEFLKTADMPWAHWWGGGDERKLLKALHIQHYPTIFVLDHKGTIRYRGVRGKQMDAAVDALLKEIEAGAKPGS